MKKLLLAAACCCLAAAPALAQSAREEPGVEVLEQSSSPLQVSTETKWANKEKDGLEVRLVLKNTGERAVRAYAVRVGTLLPDEPGGGCFLHNVERRAKMLRPGRTDARSTWRGVPLEGEQPSYKALVDFVEFEDGLTWGDDSCRSSEYLDGLRTGARAARAALWERLAADGLEELLRQLSADEGRGEWRPAATEGRSEAWAAGFKWGAVQVRERLRRAARKGGLSKAEEALRRPFDASEEP